ncbi:hypothetical protein ANN_24981 [Periplaneta americana]|uniref:Uncharacterized protein n=1 Tax=Periplaneta americana TaxID=6978 RepID=A0ABQ8S037_PERAM|nr:hypothetical protein ANN_24981 [Periplaneta americana]
MARLTESVKSKISSLLEDPILGGWTSILTESITGLPCGLRQLKSVDLTSRSDCDFGSSWLKRTNYKNLATHFAHILVAKPHTADMERLESLKNTEHARMSTETENLYFFVHYNMPRLAECNPWEAVLFWLRKCERCTWDRPKLPQEYYTGIFSCAKKRQGDSPQEDNSAKTKKKIF